MIYYDCELKGFGVKVSPAGVKSWCVEYRPRAGGRGTAKRRMVLGSTFTLTPDQARTAARKVLAAVALGEDPAASKSRMREMPTFFQFAHRYLSEEAAAKLKPRSLVNYRIYLRKHAGTQIGNLRLDKITTNDIAKMHRRIGQTKPVTANRVVLVIPSVKLKQGAFLGSSMKASPPRSTLPKLRTVGR